MESAVFEGSHPCLTVCKLCVLSAHLTGRHAFLCRPEWKGCAQRPREDTARYHKRIREMFTFRMHDVPEHLRMPNLFKDGSHPPAKRGVHLKSGFGDQGLR